MIFRIEKDKQSLQREIEDLQAAVDLETKGKSNFEKMIKQLELQLNDTQIKCDEQVGRWFWREI